MVTVRFNEGPRNGKYRVVSAFRLQGTGGPAEVAQAVRAARAMTRKAERPERPDLPNSMNTA